MWLFRRLYPRFFCKSVTRSRCCTFKNNTRNSERPYFYLFWKVVACIFVWVLVVLWFKYKDAAASGPHKSSLIPQVPHQRSHQVSCLPHHIGVMSPSSPCLSKQISASPSSKKPDLSLDVTRCSTQSTGKGDSCHQLPCLPTCVDKLCKEKVCVDKFCVGIVWVDMLWSVDKLCLDKSCVDKHIVFRQWCGDKLYVYFILLSVGMKRKIGVSTWVGTSDTCIFVGYGG